jgi:hypothetical protein
MLLGLSGARPIRPPASERQRPVGEVGDQMPAVRRRIAGACDRHVSATGSAETNALLPRPADAGSASRERPTGANAAARRLV